MADDNEFELPEDWREQKFTHELEQLASNFLSAGGNAQHGAAILARTWSDVMVVGVVQETQQEFAGVLAWCVSNIKELAGTAELPPDGGTPDKQPPDEELPEEEDEDVPPDAIDEGEVVDKREAEDGQERQPVFGRRKGRRER